MREHRSANFLNVAPLTAATLVLCIAYYAYEMMLSARMSTFEGGSGAPWAIPIEVLIHAGASYREGVWDGGWQRFVLPMFMHGGILHIVFNMMSLYRMGPAAEVHFGSSNFGTIYILSGVGGICLSLILGGHVSVGASTCLFGIMGSLLAVRIFECPNWRQAWKNSSVRQVAFYIALNMLLAGLMFANVDNWGHAGGLLMGLLSGALFEFWRKHRRIGLALLLLFLCVPAAGVVASRWMIFNPHYHVHLGLQADEAGHPEEARQHFQDARAWATRWRSESAARELAYAADRARSNGQLSQSLIYYGLFMDVAPKNLGGTVPEEDPLP